MNGNSFYIMIAAIAALVLWRRPLLIPMLFMLPGVTLVFNPNVSEPAWAYGVALGLGMVLSIPLIWTTNYEVREDNLIYAQKSWGFVVAFIGIVLIRFLLRQELTDMEPQEKMAIFMMVAFGYIIPWRIVSFIKFRRLVSQSVCSDKAA